jgi:hypothetical protein
VVCEKGKGEGEIRSDPDEVWNKDGAKKSIKSIYVSYKKYKGG